jgi:Zn-dependent peptidase ImmA (M78 family)
MDPDKKRVGFVREMARKYLRQYKVDAPGTPVEEIIRGEGLRIEYRPWGPDGLSGLMLKKVRVIAVNVNKPRLHQRFSLAHELGHYALDHDYLKSQSFGGVDIDHPPETNLHSRNDLFEQEANEFAGELLVPMLLLKKKYRYERNCAKLAVLFDVSVEVLMISLMKHNLIR